MDIINGIAEGFSVALTPTNLLYVTLGVLIGTVVGLLPGLGPTAGIALLLPMTFTLEPATAIIMLAGIYYGTMYGGRIPAILLRLPGDSSSVMTTLDGYPLARQGRAGAALGITAIGSFIGGTVAIVGLTFLAPVVARFANFIGAPEMFALTLMGLMMIAMLGSGSKWKAIAIAGAGLLVAAIGLDPVDGTPRLTFGSLNLSVGINIVPVAVGLFGLGEILYTTEHQIRQKAEQAKIEGILPTKLDWIASRMAIMRASVIGFFIGVLPGGGGTISSVLAYGVEKKVSKHPERFGKGAIEGLAATETADNGSSNSAFIPLLTLGIPPNAVLALLYGALLLQNVTPGPQLMEERPEVFWGVIASMYIGNLILLALNLPLIRVFVQILKVPPSILNPIIVIIAFVGVYSVNNSVFDIYVAIAFGILGYLLKKWNFDLGPFILGFILGPIMEVQFRRTMLISDGSFGIFVDRPVSLTIFIIIGILASMAIFNAVRNKLRGGHVDDSGLLRSIDTDAVIEETLGDDKHASIAQLRTGQRDSDFGVGHVDERRLDREEWRAARKEKKGKK